MILSSIQYSSFAGAKAPVPAYYPSGSEALASLTPDTAGMDAGIIKLIIIDKNQNQMVFELG